MDYTLNNDILPAESTPSVVQPQALPIERQQVMRFTKVLRDYKTGKARTEARIIASENWWKLRNTMEEQRNTHVGADGGFVSVSAWLHNVIVSKHADAMDSFPEPNILPREANDRQEATTLSAIVPCILEQNEFEETYSDATWQKLKTGTGAYKVVWDTTKLHGLGDVSIQRVNLLNVYWEPGITDVQQSRYFFQTELVDKDILQQQYPQLEDKLKSNSFIDAKFLYDDAVDTSNKSTVIEVYYHKYVQGKKTLQYCKYVEDTVLYATENDPDMANRGLYDHGLFPYVFDTLFPVEGSPCGYGFVDLCKNPQTEIDLMKTAFVKNAMVGSTPRYFSRGDGTINESEFLDLSKPIVHVSAQINEDYLRRIETDSLDGNHLSMLDRTIQELRETSGNTETSTGNIASGVTAASAIAALQEASGKGSRDSTQSAYRSYSKIVNLCVELIRQFYDAPRQFRITGEMGQTTFVSYDNSGIRPQHQGYVGGEDMGYRLPTFDIKVSAQKRSVYTKVSQNELALQFFNSGFFNPQLTDQTLMCLDMMDFEGKDEIIRKVSQQGTMHQKLIQYMQMALTMAMEFRPDLVQGLSADVMATMNGLSGNGPVMQGSGSIMQPHHIKGVGAEEPAHVKNARTNADQVSQPDSRW